MPFVGIKPSTPSSATTVRPSRTAPAGSSHAALQKASVELPRLSVETAKPTHALPIPVNNHGMEFSRSTPTDCCMLQCRPRQVSLAGRRVRIRLRRLYTQARRGRRRDRRRVPSFCLRIARGPRGSTADVTPGPSHDDAARVVGSPLHRERARGTSW